MERIHSLKRNEVLRELKTYKKYTGNTEKDIVESLGKKDIQTLRIRKTRKQKISKKREKKPKIN